jgi:hypothetical protein
MGASTKLDSDRAKTNVTESIGLKYSSLAMENYLIKDDDATNAFAQSDTPAVPVFLGIDDQNHQWYMDIFGIDIPPCLSRTSRIRRCFGKFMPTRLFVVTNSNLLPTNHVSIA